MLTKSAYSLTKDSHRQPTADGMEPWDKHSVRDVYVHVYPLITLSYV